MVRASQGLVYLGTPRERSASHAVPFRGTRPDVPSLRVTYRGKKYRLQPADEARATRIRELVKLSGARDLPQDTAKEVFAKAATCSENALADLFKLVAAYDAPKSGGITFAEVAQMWTSGELATRHPDQVKRKRSVKSDVERFRKINATIGKVPISSFTLDDAERAMRALPAELASRTRRQYAQLIVRLLKLCVYPLRLIKASPIPAGFLPSQAGNVMTQWLRPAEDLQLMQCTAIALSRRMLWGFLAREACRISEALELTWDDLDLSAGMLTLRRTKSGAGRSWALQPGTAEALRLWREHADAPRDVVFRAPAVDHHADYFREDLKAAGVTRSELYASGPGQQPIRVHDLRATAITLWLAAGKNERYCTDRSGHSSSQMLAKYARAARTAAEIGLGELTPLADALPDLRTTSGPPGGSGITPSKKPSDISDLGTLGGIRTPDQRIRNPPLYPAELRARSGRGLSRNVRTYPTKIILLVRPQRLPSPLCPRVWRLRALLTGRAPRLPPPRPRLRPLLRLPSPPTSSERPCPPR